MGVGELSEQEEAALWTGRKYMIGEQGYVKIELHPVTSIPVITFSGKIMGNTAGMAIEKVRCYVTKVPGYVIFDVGECDYISSTTLGFIASLALERHESGYDIFVTSMTEKMRWLLSVLDMDDF
ncbi:MAG: STAS domain-containing protein, partial [Planctomycetes bacterium]|nr:STAS domain-containing protein [Planctomycetota bacterium]